MMISLNLFIRFRMYYDPFLAAAAAAASSDQNLRLQVCSLLNSSIEVEDYNNIFFKLRLLLLPIQLF